MGAGGRSQATRQGSVPTAAVVWALPGCWIFHHLSCVHAAQLRRPPDEARGRRAEKGTTPADGVSLKPCKRTRLADTHTCSENTLERRNHGNSKGGDERERKETQGGGARRTPLGLTEFVSDRGCEIVANKCPVEAGVAVRV